jgi:phosphoribosylformimino-5-aminoimidazole carboxamide ribonucleotide (ProFAR) isomerase
MTGFAVAETVAGLVPHAGTCRCERGGGIRNAAALMAFVDVQVGLAVAGQVELHALHVVFGVWVLGRGSRA